MLKTKPSLHTNLVLIVTFTMLIVMSLYTVYFYTTTKNEMINQMQKSSKLSLITLEENISSLISAYAVTEYEQLLQTELERHNSTFAIIVEDYNMGKILGQGVFHTGKIRNIDGDIVDYDFENKKQNKKLQESYFTDQYKITSSTGKVLGIIHIYTSSHLLSLKLNNIIINSFTQFFIIILLQTVILIFGIKHFVLKPILNIVKVMSNTDADGIPTTRHFEQNSKEISVLVSTLNSMLDLIRDSKIKLHSKNKELQLSANVFNDTHGGILITDADNNIINVNPAFCTITGYSKQEVLGKNPRIFNSGQQTSKFYQQMWQQINNQAYWQGEVWNYKKNGDIYAELLTISVLKDELNNVVNYLGVFTDITESKRQKEKLNLMAHYDVLTGLPNRILFVDRFIQAIAHSKRTGHQLAVCFLDLDNFKPINDKYGHSVGDKVLVEVAERITDNIREDDTVSRQGGDEFTLLLNDINSLAQCEQTLQRIHDALAKPYVIDGYSNKITASSGFTLYPDDDGDVGTLLRHADQAMYQAKLKGKHRYHLFNPKNDQRTIQKHHQLEEIEYALNNNQFQLYYQPKVNMVTGKVFGAEALIRWIHPKKGLIPPLSFLPIIEETELEIKVGKWVINEAISQLDTWFKQNIQVEVSVNISSYHLLSDSFFDELSAAITKYPSIDSRYLQLEILESSALGDLNAISTIVKTCKKHLNVKVALDDFGTGYSSLTHLRSIPVDTVKIDQSFVRDMIDDPSDSAIIDGIIGLSESFNRNVIAEGVETTQHGLMLLLMGCTEAQGYGIAKPMPADDFFPWFKNYTPNQEWLQCGNQDFSIKEKKVKIFRLVIKSWLDIFIAKIQSSPEKEWLSPIMDSKHCSCHAWLQRTKQDMLFKQDYLTKIEEAHDELHRVANSLLTQYQNGVVDSSIEGLSELQTTFDNMNEALNLYKLNNMTV